MTDGRDHRTADLVDALRQTLNPISTTRGFETVQEMAAKSGRTIGAVRKELHLAASEGRLEMARVQRPTLDGRNAPVPGYRIKPRKRRPAR